MKHALLHDIFSRGVASVIDRAVIEKSLAKRKLRIKHGIDPTTPSLHLGHAVIYQKLRTLQKLGHTIVFLIGDFTARFGDPTERLETRKLRTKREVRNLARPYIGEIGKILDLTRTEIRYNGEWYDRMRPEEFIRLFSHFTVNRMLERDMFATRMKAGAEVRLHEVLYPVLQAYDSVVLKSDLTVIGEDQLFNELQARKLQKDFGQSPQGIIAMKLLIGTDGVRKMSQSLGNAIGIREDALSQYGKIMSIPDTLIPHYFELVTPLPLGELNRITKEGAIHPRDTKAHLAREIITSFHGARSAKEAEAEFNRIFRDKQLPSILPEKRMKRGGYPVEELLMKLALVPSKSHAKRLLREGAVEIDGVLLRQSKTEVAVIKPLIIRVGKKTFVRIVPSP